MLRSFPLDIWHLCLRIMQSLWRRSFNRAPWFVKSNTNNVQCFVSVSSGVSQVHNLCLGHSLNMQLVFVRVSLKRLSHRWLGWLWPPRTYWRIILMYHLRIECLLFTVRKKGHYQFSEFWQFHMNRGPKCWNLMYILWNFQELFLRYGNPDPIFWIKINFFL